MRLPILMKGAFGDARGQREASKAVVEKVSAVMESSFAIGHAATLFWLNMAMTPLTPGALGEAAAKAAHNTLERELDINDEAYAVGAAFKGNMEVETTTVSYTWFLFRNDEQTAAAEGYFIHVQVDRATRRPVGLDQEMRSMLSPLVVD